LDLIPQFCPSQGLKIDYDRPGCKKEGGQKPRDVGGENKTVDFCSDTYTAINVYKSVVLMQNRGDRASLTMAPIDFSKSFHHNSNGHDAIAHICEAFTSST
jgi:hypothetical protein